MLFYIFKLFRFGVVKVSNFKIKMLGIQNGNVEKRKWGKVEKCNISKVLEKKLNKQENYYGDYGVLVTLYPLGWKQRQKLKALETTTSKIWGLKKAVLTKLGKVIFLWFLWERIQNIPFDGNLIKGKAQ